jgi:predicted dehydrogenase
MKTIRWGIIGVGDVTEVKSGPGFYKARNSSLVAVMRRNGAKAKDYAERHNIPRWYDDADQLIADENVDAICIATPPYAHKDYALKAAQAGKPVYVEKPMGMNHDECQAMVEACKAAGVPLWVAYYRRAMPRFLKIKDVIDSGTIGDVRSVDIALYRPPHPGELDRENPAWRIVPEIAGAGLVVDVGVHTLDFLDYVLGPVAEVRGFAVNQGGYYEAEEQVVGILRFESGVVASGAWCFNSARKVDQTVIAGTKGSLAFSTFDTSPLILTTEAGTEEIEFGYPEHVQQPLIQTIVDELNGVGTSPSTGVSAARTTWVTDQLLRGYYAR